MTLLNQGVLVTVSVICIICNSIYRERISELREVAEVESLCQIE